MTMTRIDLFWRGLVRGFSKDMVKCHSCFLAYDNIYFVVSLVEELYVEWTLDTTSAFLIFAKITDCYKYMKEVQRLCHYNEFWVAFKTRFFDFNRWTPGISKRMEADILNVIKWFFILYYSIFWSTMEDTGIAVGYFVSMILDLHIEDVVGNMATD
jgi:hypothetical protein